MTSEAFRAVAHVLPEACLLVAAPGVVLASNPAAEQLCRRPRAELEGASLFDLVHDGEAHVRRYIEAAARTRGPLAGSLRLRTPEEEVACTCLAGVVEPPSAGRPARVLVRLRERAASTNRFRLLDLQIDRLWAEVRRRRRAEAEAHEAVRSRDELLALVSHDLRNPLNTILAGSALLLEAPLTEEVRERQIGAIRRAAERMERLTRNLLDISRLEAGHLQIVTSALDARDLVDEALSACEFHVRGSGVTFSAEIDEGLPAVRAERERILQVLDNLLSNALRYTPEGERIVISARAAGDMVRFEVTDNGPGIAPDLLPHVFDRYRQGSGNAHGFSGLGLPMAKGIVEAHGGSMSVESRPGQGTTFTFTLPVAISAASGGSAAS